MADDKGSDLDVFEGLTKKKKTGTAGGMRPAAATMRGGLAPPRSPSGSSLPLPKLPPKKRVSSGAVSLPKPKLPPPKSSKAARSGAISMSGSKPPPPPSKSSAPINKPAPPPPSKSPSAPETPAITVQETSAAELAEPSGVSVLPGAAAAELDWDDDEEATAVFDRSEHELFDELRAKHAHGEKRGVGAAAALLASSGRNARPVKTALPAAPKAPQDSLPRIPAPAPIPRDLSHSSVPATAAAPTDPPPNIQAAAAAKNSKWPLVAVFIAVAGLLVGAFLYLRQSSASPVEILVTRNGKAVEQANIYVDGQKKCEFAPCKLELKPGTKTIRVVSGLLAGSQQVDIKGGKEHSFSIALGEASAAAGATAVAATATATAAPDGPGIVKLTTSSKDEVKVSINGKAAGVMSADKPLEVSDLKPGTIKLRFEGGDEYGVVEKQVELKAGETLDVDEIKLPLLKVKTTFELATKGATVKLIKEKDGKKSSSHLAFRGGKATKTLDTSYSWTLRATARGYEDLEQSLSFDDSPKTTVKVELSKEEQVAATTSPSTPHTTAGGGPRRPPPPPSGGTGYINANSIPPSKVIIDGRPRGSTPVTGVRVSAGTHTVTFIHKTRGSKTRTVTVAKGQTKTAAVRFKKK